MTPRLTAFKPLIFEQAKTMLIFKAALKKVTLAQNSLMDEAKFE